MKLTFIAIIFCPLELFQNYPLQLAGSRSRFADVMVSLGFFYIRRFVNYLINKTFRSFCKPIDQSQMYGEIIDKLHNYPLLMKLLDLKRSQIQLNGIYRYPDLGKLFSSNPIIKLTVTIGRNPFKLY